MSVHTLSLSVHTIRLSVHTISLSVHTISLSVHTISLSTHTIRLSIHFSEQSQGSDEAEVALGLLRVSSCTGHVSSLYTAAVMFMTGLGRVHDSLQVQ